MPMRSAELAEAAGVTVRTLRHYHALGLMPEPPRSENGYREYRPRDLVRLLRIKRLASLGFSLEWVGEMLADDAGLLGEGVSDDLDELDSELTEQIEDLRRQRALIARLRASGSVADVSVCSARFLSAFARLTDDVRTREYERDVLVLADSLLPSELRAFLDAYHGVLLERGLVGRYVELSEHYISLSDDAPEEERRELAEAFAAFLDPLVAELLKRFPRLGDVSVAKSPVELMVAFDRESLNAAQIDVDRMIDEDVAARIVERARTDAQLHDAVKSLLDPDATS